MTSGNSENVPKSIHESKVYHLIFMD